jgi:hypothetical protein
MTWLGSTTRAPPGVGSGSRVVCITKQVTDSIPIGTLNLNNAATRYITWADSYDDNNGVAHTSGSSLFSVVQAGEYTINTGLFVSDTTGGGDGRSMFYVALLRYKERPSHTERGALFRSYYLGSSYLRDDNNNFDDVALGGCIRVHFERSDEQFELAVHRRYAQTSSQVAALDNSQCFLTIERHAYELV